MVTKPRLSKAQKRVAIAKDVITQLRAEKFSVLIRNGYCTATLTDKGEKSLQKSLKKGAVKNCFVCAKGALFLSYVRKYNHFDIVPLDIEDLNDGYDVELDFLEVDILAVLTKIFDKDNLDLIEYAFEGEDVHERFCDAMNENDITAFYNLYPDDEDRLVAIIKNIIKNKGTFKLPVLVGERSEP